MKLIDLLKTLSPNIKYNVSVVNPYLPIQAQMVDGIGLLKLENKEDVKSHLDYTVASVDRDFNIVVRASKIV